MKFFPVFLSVVIVARNQSPYIEKILSDISKSISTIVSDYEIIIVDNASNDESLSLLKTLTAENGFPNIQVYALTKEVDTDTASWVGLENALGDFTAVIDPFADDIGFLENMLEKALHGNDVVFASNAQKPAENIPYQFASYIFNLFYRWFNGISLTKEAPHYRIVSKRVINFILQHSQPALTYRHLPATGGFARIRLKYNYKPEYSRRKSLSESIDRGIKLLVSTTRAPMRLVTSLSLFGAIANLIYSVYVVIIALLPIHVAPGWISLSLQQSGMFLLISLVLLVLGEYILHMASLSNEGPLYHIAQEFTSTRMTRQEKLNIEDTNLKPLHPSSINTK